MTIGALCTKEVVTVPRNATVEEAAASMRVHHVGDMIVVDTPGSRVPVGIITDRDVAIEVVGQGLTPAKVTVGSVMSGPLLSLREEEGMLEALSRMASRGVRRAPVLDRDGHLAGLVSVDDLVPLLAQELAEISALIRRGQLKEARRTEDTFRDEYAM